MAGINRKLSWISGINDDSKLKSGSCVRVFEFMFLMNDL